MMLLLIRRLIQGDNTDTSMPMIAGAHPENLGAMARTFVADREGFEQTRIW